MPDLAREALEQIESAITAAVTLRAEGKTSLYEHLTLLAALFQARATERANVANPVAAIPGLNRR